MTCGECGNTLPALDGFPKKVLCKHYKLHMSNKADASRCDYFEKKLITNADRIRAMTDGELSSWINDHVDCNRRCEALKDGCMNSDSTCMAAWLEWLKEEA